MTLTADPTKRTTDWPVLRALSADVSQRVFRACLTALARPGTRHRLPTETLPTESLPEGIPAVALVPLALTDLMAPLAGLGAAVEPARQIASATGARLVEPEQARFALALEDPTRHDQADRHDQPDGLGRLPIGSNWSPELGAVLCQRVTALDDHADRQGQGALRLTLSGPGIKSSTMIMVTGLSVRFFATRDELTAAFPTGIDLLLITDDGTVTGLPRTTTIEVG